MYPVIPRRSLPNVILRRSLPTDGLCPQNPYKQCPFVPNQAYYGLSPQGFFAKCAQNDIKEVGTAQNDIKEYVILSEAKNPYKQCPFVPDQAHYGLSPQGFFAKCAQNDIKGVGTAQNDIKEYVILSEAKNPYNQCPFVPDQAHYGLSPQGFFAKCAQNDIKGVGTAQNDIKGGGA
jgi:hypothetical protein